ncbi:MAG: tandem-95 repeat protein [Pseudomonadota bacterium]
MPIALDDAAQTSEDTPLVIPVADLIANDTDPDGGTPAISGIASQPSNGTATFDATAGTLTYTPNPDFAGQDSLTVTVSDGQGGTAQSTLAITVAPVNDAPSVSAEVQAVASENDTAPLVVDLLEGASDPEADPLAITGLQLVSGDARGVVVNGATLEVNPGAYSDLGGGETEVIVYSYTIDDGNGGAVDQTATITVLGADTGGVGALSDADPAPNVLPENAAFGDGLGLTLSATDPDSGDTVSYSLSDARFQVNPLGVVTVAPEAAFDHETEAEITLEATARSSDGSSSVQSFTVNVADVNEFDVGPLSDADAADNTVAEDAPDGTPVGITGFAEDADGTTNGITYTLDDDAGGRFAIDPSTGVVRVANATLIDFEAATSHTITVQAQSEDGSSATGNFDIAVTDLFENLPPVANPDTNIDDPVIEDGVVPGDASAMGNVLANDTDPNPGASLIVVGFVAGNATAPLSTATGSSINGAFGALTLNGDGSWVYALNDTDPAVQALAEGEAVQDVFSYTVADSGGLSDTTTLAITVTGSNDAPSVAAGALAATEDGPVATLDLSALGSDPDSGEDGSSVTYAISAVPADGTASIVGQELRLDPGASFQSLALGETSVVTIGITATDSAGAASASADVEVTITGTNDAPVVAQALALMATEGGIVRTLDLLTGASDTDASDVLSIANVSALPDGFTLDGTLLSVDPSDPAFEGLNDGEVATIDVTFDVADGNGGSTPQTATVTVEGVTDQLPPNAPTLVIAAADRTAPGETDAARVTLQGQTSPGAEVDLISADGSVVISTVLADVSGAFRIPDIALPVGVTAFQAVARDPQTGLESISDGFSFARLDPAPDAPPNAVLAWIDQALETIAESGVSPDFASRALAMQAIAVENALAAVNDEDGYLFSYEGAGADPSLAVAHAAHGVLVKLFPGQTGALNAVLADFVDVSSASNAAQAQAETLGQAAAARVLTFRQDDGWDINVFYIGSDADGEWRPTGPSYFNALNPQWADLDPFTLIADDQFRPDAPPSLLSDTITDDAYANDLERVRALGASDSTERTDDQTQIARFWAAGTGTATPPGTWARIAREVSKAEGLSLSQSAELMLKLNLALADAAIAAWDTKYTYDLWRPVTVLSEGGSVDGTPIAADPTWAPLLTTPAHPEYVSGHSTYSGAAATVLSDFFGDDYAFESTSSTTSGPITRSFASFKEAAEEGGESRIFGGIHFDFSNQTGLALGEDVAEWVLASFDPLNDTVAPTITLLDLDPDALSEAPVIEGVLTDNLSGALSLRAVVDGSDDYLTVAVDSLGGFAFDPGDLDDGLHNVSFIAQDAAGNTALEGYEFFISSTPPTVTLDASSISASNTALGVGARIAGDIDLPPGVDVAALSVQIGDGPVLPLNFDADGLFSEALEIGALAPGSHQIKLRVADTAGNETITTINATLAERPPFEIIRLEPRDLESEVGSTVFPLIQFSREVDTDTLNSDSFFAITATGEKMSANITPFADGTGAWMFFDEPLPGATAIELIVDGDLIKAADGAALDGDGDGVPGGQAVQRFTTVSLVGLESTSLVGRIVDPGEDLYMMTPDDFASGPAGVTDYANHTYLNPIENADVHVLGRPDLQVFTDENGFFELTGVPSGRVKVVVDGRTATNAPDGIYWPEMVLDVVVRPGQENTIMGGMGPLEAQLERQEDQALFLPRILEAAVTPASATEVTIVKPLTAAGATLTQEQFDLISLEVQPGSMIDDQGNPIANPELGLALVPPEMVIDMLPDGVPTPPIFLTIQGPDGGVFIEEAVLTIPNVYGLPPGDKTEFFSYDHQTGLLVLNGVGTVSEDGTFIRTDPGSGIIQPGWNGPAAISRVLLDPLLPCPPGTNHANNFEAQGPSITDSVEMLSAEERFIREKYGEIGDGDSIFVNNFLANSFREAEARIAVDLEIMNNASIAGDSGPIGGPVDAGFWGIMATKLTGDIAETIVESAANLTPLKLVKTKAATFAISKWIDFHQSNVDRIYPVETAALADIRSDAESAASIGIQGKFGSNSPQTSKFAQLADDANAAINRIDALEDQWEEQKQQHQNMVDVLTEFQDDFGDLFDKLSRGEEPTQAELESMIGPVGSDPKDGPLLQLLSEIDAIGQTAQDSGTMLGTIYEIYGILRDVTELEDELFGDLPETIAIRDIETPPSQVVGEYEISYGPRLFYLLTNMNTGEEERSFTASGERPWLPTTPGTNYLLEIFDPVTGYTGSTTFAAPLGFRVNSLTNLEFVPTTKPILKSTDGVPVGAGGLTDQQAHIIGIDPNTKDNLLPGTGITDKQALISGLSAFPGGSELTGLTGLMPLDGSSQAVAIGGTSINGADLRAYVATGDLGLAIVDVSDSTLPVLLGQIDLPGFAEGVVVIDRLDLVAVALGDGGLAVIDVRDPVRPVVDALYEDLTVTAVIAADDRLIVGQNGRIKLIDVASGVDLTSVGVGIGPEQQFAALTIEDGQIYALGTNGTLHVVSLDGTTLSNRGTIDLTGTLYSLPVSPTIASQDGTLWIGVLDTDNSRTGIITVDATDPDALSVISGLNTAQPASDFGGEAVALNGSGFGVAAKTLGLPSSVSDLRIDVFDSRDPNSVDARVSNFALEGTAEDIAWAAGEAFIATGLEGLQIIRPLGVDVIGEAPEIAVTTLPDDVDGTAPGLRVFQGQTLRFDVATDDDLQVRSVEVLINGNTVLSTVVFPWDLTITLPTIEDLGTDQLEVQFRATDTGGNSTITAPVEITMIEDITPFEIVSITPEDGADLLPGSVRSITVAFSKSVETDTVNAENFALVGPNGPLVPASISVRESATEVQLTYPAAAFEAGNFTLTIDASAVTDRAGTPLAAADITTGFAIEAVDGQTWISTADGSWNDPVNWATGVAPVAGDDVVVPLLDGVTATISSVEPDPNSVTVSGEGLLLVNSGQAGVELTTPTLNNVGTIDVAYGQMSVTGQTNNSGTLQVSSLPNDQSLRGTLSLTGSVSNSGDLVARNGGRIELAVPVIDNQGTIIVGAAPDTLGGVINTSGALTELTGGGTLIFVQEAGATNTGQVFGSVGTAEGGVIDETFRNVDNTITGTGQVGPGFVFENAVGGTVEARSGDLLQVSAGRVVNDGVMQALNGGALLIDSNQTFFFGGIFAFVGAATVDNSDGVIRADGGTVNLTQSSINGGLLETVNGGNIFIGSGSDNGFARLDGLDDPLEIVGTVINTGFLQLAGEINNQGTLTNSIGSTAGEFQLIEDTVLTGGGSLFLFSTDTGSVDERVASIINDFSVLFDEDTGDVLFDEFGQPLVEFETRLTLDDHAIRGAGRIGSEEDEGEFGSQPLFKIDLQNGSEIEANDFDDSLELLNVELSINDGTIRSNAGSMRIVDSDIFNFSDILIDNGGEMRLEFGAGASNGGFLFNEGSIDIFDGDFSSDFFVFNAGEINVWGGNAYIQSMTNDAASNAIVRVADAVLEIESVSEVLLDTGLGDAEVIFQDTSGLAIDLIDFEFGDAINLNGLDPSSTALINFVNGGSFLSFTLDDGFSQVDMELVTSGSYAGVSAADFFLSENDSSGVLFETSIEIL